MSRMQSQAGADRLLLQPQIGALDAAGQALKEPSATCYDAHTAQTQFSPLSQGSPQLGCK